MRILSIKLTNLMLILMLVIPLGVNPANEPVFASAVSSPNYPAIEVEQDLLNQINADGSTGYLIFFRERPDLSAAQALDWETRGQFVVDELRKTAAESQQRIRAYLEAEEAEYDAFWIDNVIIVEASSRQTFQGLMQFGEIEALRTRRLMGVIEPSVEPAEMIQAVQAVEPNITQVNADQAWADGFRGDGLVVANIDTGVRFSHEALVGQYRGNLGGGAYSHDYNWLGAAGGANTPVDDHGHGTHTMGTMVGDDGGSNQIGIAPGAKWIACDGCESRACPDAALLTCAQWVAAPYPASNPTAPDATKRPHVVNNSWGDCEQSYDGWFQGAVDNWHAAGIYPVFSNGNSGNCSYTYPPGLNTVGNPARYGNVTGVGSSGQSNGQYATHSTWGPTDAHDTVNPRGYPEMKPQVIAPGVNIRSAVPASDTSYQGGWNGTSMSAPHVSGLVALMWDAGSCLIGDYASTETIIEETATQIYYDDGSANTPSNYPNYATGWGEIDAYAAVQAANMACGDFDLDVTPAAQAVCKPDDALFSVNVRPTGTSAPDVSLSTQAVPANATTHFSGNPVSPPGISVLTLSSLGSTAAGDYTFKVIGTAGSEIHTDTVDLSIEDSAPVQVALSSPADGALGQSRQPTFVWDAISEARVYTIEIATDDGFTHIVDAAGTTSTSYTPAAEFAGNTQYFWRMQASNICGSGTMSAVWSFTTETEPGECRLGSFPQTIYEEAFEQEAPGWQSNGVNTTWTLSTTRAIEGNYAYHAVNLSEYSDQMLLSPIISLPTNSLDLTLQYWNYQEIEDSVNGCFDGGILEVTKDGGTTWQQLPSSVMLTDPYHGEVSGNFDSPLAGREAWCGDPQDWLKSVVDLDAYSGENVQFRFRLGTDASQGREGWYIDAFRVQRCVPEHYQFSFGPDSEQQTGPSTVVTHTFTLRNLGLSDAYTLTLTQAGAWETQLETPGPVSVGIGDEVPVAVSVRVPNTTGRESFVVTAQSVATPTLVLTASGVTTSTFQAGVSLTPESQTHSGLPGGVVRHLVELKNTGTYTDSFALNVTGNRWATQLSMGQTTALSPGDTISVAIDVNIPETPEIQENTVFSDVFTLIAKSNFDPTTASQATGNSRANASSSLSLTPDIQKKAGAPGELILYTFHIANTGSYTDVFRLSAAGQIWETSVPTNTGLIVPGGSELIEVMVHIPDQPIILDTVIAADHFTLTAASAWDLAVLDSARVTTSVSVRPGVELTATLLENSGYPGQTAPYTLTIKNLGDYTDRFVLSADGGWVATLPVSQTQALAPNQGVDVLVWVEIPANAEEGAAMDTTITAASTLDATEQAQLVVSTKTVFAKRYLPFVIR